MRISDWSSDVCSSDLYDASRTHAAAQLQQMISRTVRVTVNHVRHVLLLHRRADRRLVDVHDRRGFVALFGAALVAQSTGDLVPRVARQTHEQPLPERAARRMAPGLAADIVARSEKRRDGEEGVGTGISLGM